MNIEVRQARLDDAAAISALLRSPIERWQRFTEASAVEDCRYQDLRIAERWLHGGAWMSVETGAIQLARLLTGAGLPLVAERRGRIIAYLEAHPGKENEPFGNHWGIAHLMEAGDPAKTGDGARALLARLREIARENGGERVLISGRQAVAPGWYGEFGFERLARARRYRLTAQGGRVFYRASEHENEDSAQIDGWEMAIGRICNARFHWDRDWRRMWDSLLEMGELRVDRFRLTIAGQEALVCARQGAYHRHTAEISLWSKKPLSIQLMIALREWAFRHQYRELQLLMHEDYEALLGENAETDGYFLDTYILKDEEEADFG